VLTNGIPVFSLESAASAKELQKDRKQETDGLSYPSSCEGGRHLCREKLFRAESDLLCERENSQLFCLVQKHDLVLSPVFSYY
jgi:hypothetical protein